MGILMVCLSLWLGANARAEDEQLRLNVERMRQEIVNTTDENLSPAEKAKKCQNIKNNLAEFLRNKKEMEGPIKQFKCETNPLAIHVDWCKFQLDTMKIIDFGIKTSEDAIKNHCSSAA